ncbi:MAG: MerR family transcriptional regulator [Gammaproteobacteria bacterium]|nr:MerR family transcriptional regulator [Gammaproteobacteria bacterium]
MLEARTYAITELVQLTGFDRRTIVYYLQEGLLPRAGRRGPHTRYPEECLIRLRFIRGMKEHQDQGRSETITLADMRRLLGRIELPQLRAMLERNLPLEEIRPMLAPPAEPRPAPQVDPLAPATAQPAAVQKPTVGDGRSYGLADAGIRNRDIRPPRPPHPVGAPPQDDAAAPRPGAMRPGEQSPGTESAADIERAIGELLRDLEMRPSLTQRRTAPGAAEQWTEVPITGRIYLSVRGLAENDAPLADAVGRAMKKLLRAR